MSGTMPPLHYYAHVRTKQSLVSVLRTGDPAVVNAWLIAEVQATGGPDLTGRVVVRDLPTARWGFQFPVDPVEQDIIVAMSFADQQAVDSVRSAMEVQREIAYVGMGADAPVAALDLWRPGVGADGVFGTEQQAFAAVAAAPLLAGSTTGRGVNVVIFDSGLDPGMFGWKRGPNVPRQDPEDPEWTGFNPLAPLGGWAAAVQGQPTALTEPWKASGGHGSTMARLVTLLAPDVHLWDVPFLPSAIGDVPQFLSDAHQAYVTVLNGIAAMRNSAQLKPGQSDRWVLVNAWGIYDRRAEPVLGDYTENRQPGGHVFNLLMDQADDLGLDVVFGAGNAGPFFPSWRCGPRDWGPGRGIWGANGHEKVLSVGATRSDHAWIGYSSHGPGPADRSGLKVPMLTPQKPDLCLPSNFADSGSAAIRYTGTSAACAMAAGVVAAMRSMSDPGSVPPAMLRKILRETTWPKQPYAANVHDERMGWGVLNAEAALSKLLEA